MPRTYLKSSQSAVEQNSLAGTSRKASSNSKENKSKKSSQGNKSKEGKENKLFDDSEDFPNNNRRSKNTKPLDESLECNKDDTFDKLFNTVDVKKMRAPAIVSSVDLSSEKDSTLQSNNDSENCWGLFKSFSDKGGPGKFPANTGTAAAIVVNPVPQIAELDGIHDRSRTKPATNASDPEQRTSSWPRPVQHPDLFSSLLAGDEDEGSAAHLIAGPPEDVKTDAEMPGTPGTQVTDDSVQRNALLIPDKRQIWSPANFFSHTPGARKAKTSSYLTSTPVLSISRFSNVSSHSKTRSSIPEEDDVFITENEMPEPDEEKRTGGDKDSQDDLCVPESRLKALSSNEIFPQTPQSFVNPARGKKTFGGPPLSMMNHYQFRPTLLSPASFNSSKSKVIWSPRSVSDNSQSRSAKYSNSSVKSGKGSEVSSKGSFSSSRNSSVDSESTGTSDVPSSRAGKTCASRIVSEEEVDTSRGKLSVNEELVMGCECKDENLQDWMVMCDGCLFYYHASCQGISEEEVALLLQPDPPEWFCNPCSAKFAAEDSITSKSFEADVDNEVDIEVLPEAKEDDIEERIAPDSDLSMMFTVEPLPEVAAKPGKRWRKSIAVGLLGKEMNSTGLDLHKTEVSTSTAEKSVFENFALPALPPQKGQDRRMTRRSSRLSKFSESRPLSHQAKDSNPSRHTRPSFYVVPKESELKKENRFLINENSIRQSRPSFCVVPVNEEMLNSETSAEASILVEEEVCDLDKLLSQCTNTQILKFHDAYGPDSLEGSKKVGEGAFGEVFLIGTESKEKPVLKIVPIGGELKVNDEDQTKISDMMSEVVISRSLSNLRQAAINCTTGFVEVRNCVVFQGNYPERLLQLWDEFDAEKTSENVRPDYLPVDQLYIALEFNNGGQDLEKFVFRSATQALAAWKQVVHTLAVAELELEFEHRDLHWGNILIKETDEKYVDFTLQNSSYRVDTCGVKTTIIDFSLSRLTSPSEKCTIFNNLAEDPTLFTALGADRGGDYQFDVYRMMKNENGNNWDKFTPKTNVFWLHYVLQKMITEVYYKGKKTSHPHKSGLAHMRNIKKNLLEYNSAHHWVIREGNIVDV